MTDESQEELISAALDGERVDVQALKDALSTADGREALASYLLLRAAMAADLVEPPVLAARPIARQRVRSRRWPFGLGLRVPLGVAASIAVLAAAGSFWVGTVNQTKNAHFGANQAAVQVPGAPAPPLTSAHTSPRASSEADDGVPPTPSRVLRFTPGVDWQQGS